jgi:hypothetical protein
MKALAPGGFQESFQPDVVDERAYKPGGFDQLLPWQGWIRVEVDRDPVGVAWPRDGRPPGVQLDHAPLHEADYRG